MMRRAILYTVCLWAVWLLSGCGGNGAQMRSELEQLEQQNVSGEPMLNDSLAEALVDYFDRHGTPNEKMRAKYILGRTYFCLGELPRALETYNEAADCADTTATDCDFAKLSRVHAQMASVFDQQVQPNGQLKELRMAEQYAKRGHDTLMAIDCLALQVDAYRLLKRPDTVIIITEKAYESFNSIGRSDRAAKILSKQISSLLELNRIPRAKQCIDIYESSSGFFDDSGNIIPRLSIYYYVKGKYYLAVNKLDSAEYLFRKELRLGKDLNNQIAGCKGLQEVYERRKVPDSIAKYAKLGYELNDSAYSLSEMQNIQKMQASYNYNHQRQLAEESRQAAERIRNWAIFVLLLVSLLAGICFESFRRYRIKKANELASYQDDLKTLELLQTELQDICSEEKLSPEEIFVKKRDAISDVLGRIKRYQRKTNQSTATLEERLENAPIVISLKEKAQASPYVQATSDDFRLAKELLNVEISHFYTTVNTSDYTMSKPEYEVTVLVRLHFLPIEISRLTGLSPSYVSNMRSRLLYRVFGVEGSSKEYDQRILSIV